MAFLKHLVKSLRSGRTVTLPEDESNAFYILMPMVIANQHSSVVELLNGSNFDVNFSSGRSQRSLLQIAANCGATDCLSLLLKKGAKVNAQDVCGCTSLHLAARNGHRNCLSKLLEYKADVNIRNNEGLTMLHWLAVNGRAELLSETLKHITNIDVEDSQGQTALHVACQNGHISTIVCLVDSGADVNRRDHHGATPLHFACSHGQRDTVKLLLQRRSEFSPDSRGNTPLDLAIEGGYSETCEALLLNDPCLFKQIIQIVTRLHIPQNKLLKVFSYLSVHIDSYSDVLLSNLAELATDTGHKLLSPSSDLQFQMNCILRCVHLIQQLHRQMAARHCLGATSADRNSKRSRSSGYLEIMNVLWNSLEEWLILLKLEIEEGLRSEKISADQRLLKGFCTERNKDPTSRNSISRFEALDNSPASEDASGVDMGKILDNDVPKSLSEESPKRGVICEANSNADNLSVSAESENPVETVIGSFDENMLNTMAPRILIIMQSFYTCSSCRAAPETTSQQFVEFVKRHEKVIEFLIERNPKEIFNHFRFLLDCPELMLKFLHVIRAQPFSERRSWFYENLYKTSSPSEEEEEEEETYRSDGGDMLLVARGNCFHSSCEQVLSRSPEHLMKHMSVRFRGEEGVGQGVTKEWFDVLSKEMLNPDYALFTQSADGSTFQPNSNSSINPDHLTYFRFVGQVMGLALYHRQLLGVYFTRSFYKHILGTPVGYADVASVDPDYARNLQWILDHDIADLDLGLTFSVETDVFGAMQEIELKRNGREIAVTERNKDEYVGLVAQLRMTKAIEPQVNSFLVGFHSFIPRSLIQMFGVDELCLMLSGLREIDVVDWRKNTDYSGYDDGDRQVGWFWEIVGDLDAAGRVQLLQFVTGSSCVPYGGFGSLMGSGEKQKFTIVRCDYSPMVLPSTSTCINMLKLPEYPSKEEMKQRMMVAIKYGSQGFGLV